MLGISLTDDHIAGESSYDAHLAQLCQELEERGIARISDGALCTFPAGFTGRDGEPHAAHHPQVRRRLRLRHHGPRHHPVPGPRTRGQPRPVRRGRAAEHAPAHGHGHGPRRRLAAGHGGGRARADRQRAGGGREDPEVPLGRPGQADGPAGGGRGPRPRRHRRQPARAHRGGTRRDRPAGGHRRGQVRRPLRGARHRVRLRLRPDAGPERQHRTLRAVRRRPDPLDPAQGRGAGAGTPRSRLPAAGTAGIAAGR